jgi:hypothetical protein
VTPRLPPVRVHQVRIGPAIRVYQVAAVAFCEGALTVAVSSFTAGSGRTGQLGATSNDERPRQSSRGRLTLGPRVAGGEEGQPLVEVRA